MSQREIPEIEQPPTSRDAVSTFLAAAVTAALLASLPGLCLAGPQQPLDEQLATAQGSPLLRAQFPTDEIRRRGLGSVPLANGIHLDFEDYAQSTRLDADPAVQELTQSAVQAQYLTAAPRYSETVTQMSDRLIVDRQLRVELKSGVCSQPALPASVAQFCFRPKAGRLPVQLASGLSEIRAALAAAPAARVVKKGVTAGAARGMSDAQLLDLLLNSDARRVRLVSVLPLSVHDARPVSAQARLHDFRAALAPQQPQLTMASRQAKKTPARPQVKRLSVATRAQTAKVRPVTRVQAQPGSAGKTFPTKYFLTGFTLGREISDTWEHTFANSTWLTDRYYVQISYHVAAGFGLRFPFSVSVKATERKPTGSSTSTGGRSIAVLGESKERDVQVSVAPVDVGSDGKPAYSAVGLDPGKYFKGKEFVLELRAGCSFHASIPGPNLHYNCPSIDESASRDINPVLGSERSRLGELWLNGKVTGLGIDVGIGSAYLDVGLAADMTDGRIGVRVQALEQSRVTELGSPYLWFDSRQPESFLVSAGGSSARFGFRLEEAKYGFRVVIAPQLRVQIGIDLGIYEYDKTVGPYRLDSLSVGASFTMSRHGGTVASHKYEMRHGPPLLLQKP